MYIFIYLGLNSATNYIRVSHLMADFNHTHCMHVVQNTHYSCYESSRLEQLCSPWLLLASLSSSTEQEMLCLTPPRD